MNRKVSLTQSAQSVPWVLRGNTVSADGEHSSNACLSSLSSKTALASAIVVIPVISTLPRLHQPH